MYTHCLFFVLHMLLFSFYSGRSGDVTIYMADPTRAKEEMEWEAKLTLDDMCNDLWSWISNNPNGYRM